MLGKMFEKRRLKQMVPDLLREVMMWGASPAEAQYFAEKFAKDAFDTAKANLQGMSEDTNLAKLYLSGEQPKTQFGDFWLRVMKKYEKQRSSDLVTEDDITWYWSLPTLDREFIRAKSNAYRAGLSSQLMKVKVWDSRDHMLDSVAYEVGLNTATYGLLDEVSLDVKDPTRPLSFELFRRVEAYRSIAWTPETKKILEKLNHQNSFLREQLSKGII
jgi:hypothetical protein